jgi:hypothetical protein
VYYTTASTAASGFTLNVRADASTSLDGYVATGNSITVVFINTTGAVTTSYPSTFRIDGTAVTPKWATAVAPNAGNANSIDVYSYTILKTGSGTYTVFASQTRFA